MKTHNVHLCIHDMQVYMTANAHIYIQIYKYLTYMYTFVYTHMTEKTHNTPMHNACESEYTYVPISPPHICTHSIDVLAYT